MSLRPDSQPYRFSRRDFLKFAGASGAGLFLAAIDPDRVLAAAFAQGEEPPNKDDPFRIARGQNGGWIITPTDQTKELMGTPNEPSLDDAARALANQKQPGINVEQCAEEIAKDPRHAPYLDSDGTFNEFGRIAVLQVDKTDEQGCFQPAAGQAELEEITTSFPALPALPDAPVVAAPTPEKANTPDVIDRLWTFVQKNPNVALEMFIPWAGAVGFAGTMGACYLLLNGFLDGEKQAGASRSTSALWNGSWRSPVVQDVKGTGFEEDWDNIDDLNRSNEEFLADQERILNGYGGSRNDAERWLLHQRSNGYNPRDYGFGWTWWPKWWEHYWGRPNVEPSARAERTQLIKAVVDLPQQLPPSKPLSGGEVIEGTSRSVPAK